MERDVKNSGGKVWVWLEYIQNAWRQFGHKAYALFICERALSSCKDNEKVVVWIHYLSLLAMHEVSEQVVQRSVRRALAHFPHSIDLWRESIAIVVSHPAMQLTSFLSTLIATLLRCSIPCRARGVVLMLLKMAISRENKEDIEQTVRDLWNHYQNDVDIFSRCALLLDTHWAAGQGECLSYASKTHPNHLIPFFCRIEKWKNVTNIQEMRNEYASTYQQLLSTSKVAGNSSPPRVALHYRIQSEWYEFECMHGTVETWIKAHRTMRRQSQCNDLRTWCLEIVSRLRTDAVSAMPSKDRPIPAALSLSQTTSNDLSSSIISDVNTGALQTKHKGMSDSVDVSIPDPSLSVVKKCHSIHCINFPPQLIEDEVHRFFEPLECTHIHLIHKKKQTLAQVSFQNDADLKNALQRDLRPYSDRAVRIQPFDTTKNLKQKASTALHCKNVRENKRPRLEDTQEKVLSSGLTFEKSLRDRAFFSALLKRS